MCQGLPLATHSAKLEVSKVNAASTEGSSRAARMLGRSSGIMGSCFHISLSSIPCNVCSIAQQRLSTVECSTKSSHHQPVPRIAIGYLLARIGDVKGGCCKHRGSFRAARMVGRPLGICFHFSLSSAQCLVFDQAQESQYTLIISKSCVHFPCRTTHTIDVMIVLPAQTSCTA